MTITHHPHAESLMSCSAGSMPEAFAAVMASHIALCPQCRKDLALMEKIGVTLFEQLDTVPVLKDVPVMQLRAAEADRGDATTADAPDFGDVPEPLRDFVGGELSSIKWSRIGPGLAQHVIGLPRKGRGDLRLIKVAPGLALPEHSHNGSELTLVLKGSYRDESGHYRVGDVADMMGDTPHSPIADPDDGCICLIATEGKLKFKSLLARIVQPFAGI